jgi:stage V sporulation protein G
VIITEVRIKLTEDAADRLRGFCSITFDNCFVVRDLKIIDGNNGPFVAMPSRKIMAQCPNCGTKNHLRARFCNQCGSRVHAAGPSGSEAKSKLYADIAHPINAECREMVQRRVLKEFELETERSKLPGYVSRYDEEYGNIDVPSAPEGEIRRTDAQQSKSSPAAGERHSRPNQSNASTANPPDAEQP